MYENKDTREKKKDKNLETTVIKTFITTHNPWIPRSCIRSRVVHDYISNKGGIAGMQTLGGGWKEVRCTWNLRIDV